MWKVLGTAGDCDGAQERDATGIRAPPSPGSDGWKISRNRCWSQSCRLCRSLGQRNAPACLAGRGSAPARTGLRLECHQYHSPRGIPGCPHIFLHLDPLQRLCAWRLWGGGTLASAGRIPRGAHENPGGAEHVVGCRFRPGCADRPFSGGTGELEYDTAFLELASDVLVRHPCYC